MIKKEEQKKLEFTFWGLLMVAVVSAMFALAVKVIDYNSEIQHCQTQSGYVGLEAKAECRR